MDAAQPTSEPRNSPRQRSLMGASLSFHNGRSTVDCLVRNISESGARLSVSPAVSLPQTIELLIPQKGTTRAARVVWRSESEVGVAFAVLRLREGTKPREHPEAAHPRVGARSRSAAHPSS